ncbi:MAG: glycoside hydrolase family 3 C-terminal domain-containing protein [Spirochaetaceae bacterium]
MEQKWFNSKLPINERVDSLVKEMTIEEKASQLLYTSKEIPRLNIPEYNWWNECLHGIARAGRATIYPQAMGMASAFDRDIMERIATTISDEGRAKYYKAISNGNRGQYMGLTYWTPNINIFRDPRWGRGQETYGEDPYLTGELGMSFVKGLQGEHPTLLKSAACAKHYAVHSGPESERHTFDAIVTEKDLRETYLPAFKKLVKEAKVEAVMGAYNRTNGEPCCGSKTLLEDILRTEWGFDGHVVSDCWAIRDFHEHHKVTNSPEESVALALKTGCDVNCGCTYDFILSAHKNGLITEDDIDKCLKRAVRARIRLGMFDPVEEDPWKDIKEDVIDCQKHRDLARESAAKSIVLLKNTQNILPLDKNINNLLLVGPNAANIEAMIGNYYGSNPRIITPLEGIAAAVSSGTTVEYRPGVMIDHPNKNPIQWAVFEADNYDYTVAVVGLDQRLEGEEGDSIASDMLGDRYDLKLPEQQLGFLKELSKRKAKLIVVVISGSPLLLDEVQEFADVVVWTCYPGEEGGNAIADVLFGDVNPSGRLPITFPKSLEQLPAFTDYSMIGRTYRYMEKTPLYPFGFGLSFTKYSYSNIRLEKDSFSKDEKIKVTCNLENIGENDGSEIIQLYLKAIGMPFTTPLLTLKDFKRVDLNAGESKSIEFTLKPEDLLLFNDEGKEIYQPGKYQVIVSGSAPIEQSVVLGAAKPVKATFTLI